MKVILAAIFMLLFYGLLAGIFVRLIMLGAGVWALIYAGAVYVFLQWIWDAQPTRR